MTVQVKHSCAFQPTSEDSQNIKPQMHRVFQVCCSMLQCVAVCRSVLQCVAV